MSRLSGQFDAYVASLPPALRELPVDALVTWFVAGMQDIEAPTRRNYVHALSRALQDRGRVDKPLSHFPYVRAYLLGLNRLFGFAPVRSSDRFTPEDLQGWLGLQPAPPLHILTAVAVAFLGGRRLADLCWRVRREEVGLERSQRGIALRVSLAWQKATLGNLSTTTWVALPEALAPKMGQLLASTPPGAPLWPFHPHQALPFLRRVRPSLSGRSMRTGAASSLIEDPEVSADEVRQLTGHATNRALAQYTRNARPEQLARLSVDLSERLFPPGRAI